jgi:hypothetical protein
VEAPTAEASQGLLQDWGGVVDGKGGAELATAEILGNVTGRRLYGAIDHAAKPFLRQC